LAESLNKYQIWRALQTGTNPPAEIDYTFVTEVNSDIFEFTDYTDGLNSSYTYHYIVRAVDINGNISPLFEN